MIEWTAAVGRAGRRTLGQAHAFRSEGREILMHAWREKLKQGVVIPAHPLALTAERKLDERRQRALTRYYMAAGAGGVAVGVHTTQFAIRDPKVGLYRPVLELAMEELRGTRRWSRWRASSAGRRRRSAEAEFAAGLRLRRRHC